MPYLTQIYPKKKSLTFLKNLVDSIYLCPPPLPKNLLAKKQGKKVILVLEIHSSKNRKFNRSSDKVYFWLHYLSSLFPFQQLPKLDSSE